MGTEREIDALSTEAIADSEKEFFAEAMDHADAGTDGDGDNTLETMGSGLEGQHEDEEDGEGEAEEPAGGKPEAGADGKEQPARSDDGRFKPSSEERPGVRPQETAAERGLRGELRTERERRREAETRAGEVDGLKRQVAEMQQHIAALTRQPPAQQQPAKEPPKEEIPDRWTDPDGWDNYQRGLILKEIDARDTRQRQERAQWSFRDAASKHGDTFQEAYRSIDALDANQPQTKAVLDYIMRSPNPGEAMMEVHRQSLARREVGNDPVAFRERTRTSEREALMKDPEFRKQVLEAMQAEVRPPNGGGPRPLTQLPPSLSTARGGAVGRQGAASSDAELFDEVMAR